MPTSNEEHYWINIVSVRIASIGECMIEISLGHESDATMSFGGDTLNMAVYMSRLGYNVEYVTVVGDDPFSDSMVSAWESEDVGVKFVERLPNRLPGIYAISTDSDGQRQFFYWRLESPARELFNLDGIENKLADLVNFEYIIISGITISIYNQSNREKLLSLVKMTRARGGKIVFDPNFRMRGWQNSEDAKLAFLPFLHETDIALPTFKDEQILFGDKDPYQCAQRLASFGIDEVVVKHGPNPCIVRVAGETTEVSAKLTEVPVDTTAAGDSFNAGYLGARIAGARPIDAAHAGHQLAAAVIQHRGAIIPKVAMPS